MNRLLVALFSFLCLSCKKDRCLFAGGQPARRTLLDTLPSIVIMRGVFTVVYDTGSAMKVMAGGGEYSIGLIEARLHGDTAIIEHHARCRWLHPNRKPDTIFLYGKAPLMIEIIGHMQFRSLAPVERDSFIMSVFEGGMDIHLEAHTRSLFVKNHTGSSDIHVSGTSDYLFLYSAGYGFIYAQDVDVPFVEFDNRGTGDFHVRPLHILKGSIKGCGNVVVHSRPQVVNVIISGRGKVVYKE